MINFSVRLIFLLSISLSLSAQQESIFSNDKVHEIRFEFAEQNYWSILSRNYDNNQFNVPYMQADVIIDGESVDSIGVRLKGFSSYFTTETDKKSIKIDFNEYVGGKRYQGLRKLNLNNGQGDPAIQRDAISYGLMRKSGISAPRTAYTAVYLNDIYWGLYLIVEQIDKEFLENNFGTRDGHLFKNMQNSELDWQGSSPFSYQTIFELKTDDDPDAWDRFIELHNVINNTNDASFKEEIEKVFDVERYLKVLMIDVALNNWDSYIEHGRNFYLYENANSQQFQWIPWDYNLAMGGTFSGDGGGPGLPDVNECPSIIDGTCPHSPEDFTLQIVMFLDESCCETWSTGCDDLYEEFSPTPIDECLTITNGTCPHPVTDTILQTLFTIAPFCCDLEWDGTCDLIYDDLSSGDGGIDPGPGGNFPIDMSSSEKVLIKRLLAVPEYQENYYKYWCEFLANDFLEEKLFPSIDYAGNLIREDLRNDMNNMWTFEDFEADLDQGTDIIPGLKKFISDRTVMLNEELDLLYTCSNTSEDLLYQDLVINEFCASCDSLSAIADMNGEYDDWIEIYNNTNKTVDLSNAYLSDDREFLTKWRFPLGTTIDADDYLIVWADKDDGQQGLHANFKLEKDGEFISLGFADVILDSLSYASQTTNQSAARIPNGTGNFVTNKPFSFGYNNDDASRIAESELINYAVKTWPNPVSSVLNVKIDGSSLSTIASQELSLTVTSALGERMKTQRIVRDKFEVSLQDLNPGMYIINLIGPKGKVLHSSKAIKL